MTRDPMTAGCTVLTVGHSRHSLQELIELLRQHHVTAVADVRSAPYSRFNPQFNREPFSDALETHGIRYVYLGDALGGRSDDPACYEDGRVRYDRVAATEAFKRGLARVLRGAARRRVALMCAEQEPLDCHRTLLVAHALDERGVEVGHIHADGALEPHRQAMDRLLDDQGVPREDLYRTREELVSLAIGRREKRVAYVDPKMAGRTVEQGS